MAIIQFPGSRSKRINKDLEFLHFFVVCWNQYIRNLVLSNEHVDRKPEKERIKSTIFGQSSPINYIPFPFSFPSVSPFLPGQDI